MKRLSLAIAAAFVVAYAGPALAFHPFEETYGYVAPKKLERLANRERAPIGLFGFADEGELVRDGRKKNRKASMTALGKPASRGKPKVAAIKPAVVPFPNGYTSGAIVVDTAGRRLYYVLSSSAAYSYPIAVGKQGFTWSGTEKISNKVAWPDWRPPAEMRARKPGLPEFVPGGVGNPLGAMALYLGNSLYRIHGTNDVKSIGTASSSGCIRMTNGHVMHLASMANVGTTVHVLRKLPAKIASAASRG